MIDDGEVGTVISPMNWAYRTTAGGKFGYYDIVRGLLGRL